MEKDKQHIFKIVLTGPESTGKTQLAAALSQALNTRWTPEFARFYLAHLGRPYTREDLQTIGQGQRVWEQWYAGRTERFLVCDTDWTVLHIWEHFRFGAPQMEDLEKYAGQTAGLGRPDFPGFTNLESLNPVWHWQKGYGPAVPADVYLLCAPDFPPEPDPLRENPGERDTLFEWYERLLQDIGANFMILRGEHAARLEQTIAYLHKIFGNLPV